MGSSGEKGEVEGWMGLSGPGDMLLTGTWWASWTEGQVVEFGGVWVAPGC